MTVMPDQGTVRAAVLLGVIAAGTTRADITNIAALRTGAGYASKATVDTVALVRSDDKPALADYKIDTEASAAFPRGPGDRRHPRPESSSMAPGMMNLHNLMEKTDDADLLGKVIGFAAERVMRL